MDTSEKYAYIQGAQEMLDEAIAQGVKAGVKLKLLEKFHAMSRQSSGETVELKPYSRSFQDIAARQFKEQEI